MPGDETIRVGADDVTGDASLPPPPKPPGPAIPDVEIEKELGRGGMGVVFRGRQSYLDRAVAVKVLQLRGVSDPAQFVDRFRREAKILAGLSHPHIVACYQAGATPGGDCYIIMEFIDGPNLRSWITERGPLDELDALEVARDMALALDHARQQGVIHRDVKPENVLLQRLADAHGSEAFPFRAKLADLGLARPESGALSDSDRITKEGAVLGTPATMAPEQFDDPNGVDFRADIYGLGCVLYHALCGKAAFQEKSLAQILARKSRGEAPDPKALRPAIREETRALVRAMLATERGERPQSYEDIVTRCDAVLVPAGRTRTEGTKRRRRDAGAAPGGPREPATSPLAGQGSSIVRRALAMSLVLGALGFAAWKARPDLFGFGLPPTQGVSSGSPVTGGATGGATGAASAPAGFDPVFSRSEPLRRADFLKGLEDWRTVGPATTFAADQEHDDWIDAQGVGRLARALGAGPWRVEGTLSIVDAKEAGIEVDAADGKSVAIAVKGVNKGKPTVSVERHLPDRESGEFARAKVLQTIVVEAPGGGVHFRVTLVGREVTFEVAGRTLERQTLEADAIGIALYVADRGRAVLFQSLTVQRP